MLKASGLLRELAALIFLNHILVEDWNAQGLIRGALQRREANLLILDLQERQEVLGKRMRRSKLLIRLEPG